MVTRLFTITHNPHLEYQVNEIHDTHVDIAEDGYRVHHFQYQAYGCGLHSTKSVELLVTNAGSFVVKNAVPIYKNPDDDRLCAD